MNKLPRWLRYGAALVAVALAAMFAASLQATANAGTPQTTNLKILLIGNGSSDPTTAAWQSTLDSEGVAYTQVTASGNYGSATVSLPALSSGSTGNFNGVVFAGSPYAFASGQLTALFSYEAAFGVRQVDGYTYPAPGLGLTAASAGAQDGTTDTLSAAALAALPQLKGPVPMDTGTYGYPATTVAGAPVTPWLTNSAGQVLAAVYQHPGTDPQANVAEMSLTFNYNAASLQWLLLGPGLVNWVTQNTHLGLYRNYFGQDIDDVMIADNEWSRQYQCTPAATEPVDVGCPAAVQGNAADGPPDSLMSSADVAYVVNWENQTGIKLNLAFNAIGACIEPGAASSANCSGSVAINGTTYTDPGPATDTSYPDSTGLVSALLANKANFNWITHTWSHLYLGCTVWTPLATNAATVGGSGTLAAGAYNYEVTAATAYGESEPSTAIPATVGANGSVGLSWNAATNGGGPSLATLAGEFSGGTGFWGYNVYRENPGSTTYGLVGQVPETGAASYSFTDTGATPGAAPETTSTYPTATNPGIQCGGTSGSGWVPASATDPSTSIEGQIGLDVAWANANGLTNYDPTAVVTGEHSGLESPNMPAAFTGANIQTFASDGSRQPQLYTIGSAHDAPRYPSNIYYTASNWPTELSEYNTLYVAPGVSIGDSQYPSATGRCVSSSVTSCRGSAAAESDFLSSESHIMLSHILANNPRMNYAHQSNLIGPATQNGADYGYTLLTLLNNMQAQYNTWFTVPLQQLTDTTSSQTLQKQAAWAGAQNSVSASITNGVVTVTNSGSGAAQIPVTVPPGTTVNGSAFGQSYGGTQSDWLSVGAGASQTLTESVPPTVTSAATANSIVGAALSFTVTTTGEPTPALAETGALPTGLSFTDNGNGTATISGTPAAGTGGSYPLTITATSTAGTATQSFTLTNAEAPTITSPSTAAFTVGNAGTYTATTTGYPAAAITETGALPSGLSFKDNGNGTATISGTPATGSAGSYPVTLSATNSSGSTSTLGLTITVTAAAPPAITSGSSAFFTKGQSGAFAITTSGQPIPALTESGALPAGLTFTDQGNGTALLSGTPTASGTTNLTVTATNSGGTATQSLSVIVGEAPAITSAGNAAFTTGTAGSFTVTTTGYPAPALGNSGTLPSGLTFVDNGNGTATLSGTPAAGTAGSYPVTVTATNGTGSVNQTLTVTVTAATGPAITSAASAGFTNGTAGTFTVTTTGNPVPALTETGAMPAGLSFKDNGNGTATISGTPTVSGSANLTVTATSSAGTANQTLSVAVGQTPAITSANSAGFTAGTAGSFTVTTSGYPAPTLTETGALPTGLSFADKGDGTATVSGTAATGTGGSYPITITATSTSGTTTQSFTVTVGQVPAITSASTSNFVKSTAGSFTVSSTGTPTAALSETGAMPAGLTFKDNGNGTATISGTPTASGTTNLTITAKSSAGTASQTLSVVVGQAPAITSAATATFSTGTAGNFAVKTSGYPAPALTETGALPAGLSFVDDGNGTATLSGTAGATAGGKYTLTVTAKNATGSVNQTLTVTVNQAPKFTSASSLSVRGTFSFPVTTTGYPAAALSVSGLLPFGVGFHSNGNGTGTLSGTPLINGTYKFTIKAVNAGGTTTQSFTLVVSGGILASSPGGCVFCGRTGISRFPV